MFGYRRFFVYASWSELPTWCRICLIISASFFLLSLFEFRPKRYEIWLFLAIFVPFCPVVTYMGFLRMNEWGKTNSND